MQENFQKPQDAIAIVGLGCRFPGDATSPDEYWQFLQQGRNSFSPIPPERWDIDSYYEFSPEAPGKMYIQKCSFLKTPIDQFDTQLFGISPREAEWMDPQQRLALEVAWESLENAAINPKALKSSPVGVFLGVYSHDYSDLLFKYENLADINAHQFTGNLASLVAGRISYILGLQGPSLVVDTSSSSSLVALHLACQSLLTKECPIALAGGVNVILFPEETIAMCKMRMLSPTDECKTFDEKANGYVRGEGCSILVLKRLEDALKDKNRILALIRGTGINQDGATEGLSAPNRTAQTTLLKNVWAKAGIKSSEIDYIETHGTGTSVGDPIEVHAIADALEKSRDKTLLIGSVKPNIGHLESAAGIAGVAKVVLSFLHEAIPPTIRLENLSTHINFNTIPIRVVHELTEWKRGERPRIAGVSSFGISGTNAHVILEEPPLLVQSVNLNDRPLHLLTLSSMTAKGLQEISDAYQIHLENHPEQSLADIAYTANTGRALFDYRLAIVASNKEQLLAKLKDKDYPVAQAPLSKPKMTFLFTGQSCKYPNLKQLYESQSVFKKAIERCAQFLDPQLEISLLTCIQDQEISTPLAPVLFAFEYALYELWKSWGVVPDFIMGHDIGEYAAAVAAGILSLEEGIKLVVAWDRSRGTDPMFEEFCKIAKITTFHPPHVAFISSSTGNLTENPETLADDWIRQIHQPVHCLVKMGHLQENGCDLILKIGASIVASVAECFSETTCLQGQHSEGWPLLLNSLYKLYLKGVSIDWKAFDAPYHRQTLALPTYVFQKQRCWAKVLDRLKKDSKTAVQDADLQGSISSCHLSAENEPILLNKLQKTISNQRKNVLKKHIDHLIRNIMNQPNLIIKSDQRLFEIGMDSLMAMELKNQLQADIGSFHKLPLALVFNYPNVAEIIHYFETEIFPKINQTKE